MKLLLTILAVLFIFSCKSKTDVVKTSTSGKDGLTIIPTSITSSGITTNVVALDNGREPGYPKVVYNECFNVYAIQTVKPKAHAPTEIMNYYETNKFWGRISVSDPTYRFKKGDTVDFEEAGNEFQFKDSAIARKLFNAWVARQKAKSDAIESAKHIRDSIEKCKHTYK